MPDLGEERTSLSRHRIIINEVTELQPDQIFPKNQIISSLDPNRYEEHAIYLDLDKDFFEETMSSGLVDEVTTALTVNKKDGTNLQAPTNSELVIFLMQANGLNGGASDNSNFRVRGTVTADNVGAAADDLTNQFNISRNNIRNLMKPIILPAGRFLTLVFISTGVGIVDVRLENVFAVGTEAFP